MMETKWILDKCTPVHEKCILDNTKHFKFTENAYNNLHNTFEEKCARSNFILLYDIAKKFQTDWM
jgi:hypothetical protein